MGLENSISNSWAPEFKEEFIKDWVNDEWMNQEDFDEKTGHDEMHDDNDSGTDEVRDDISYLRAPMSSHLGSSVC